MKSRKCEENLYFYIEVALFKDEVETPDEFLREQAQRVYNKFFADCSEYQLNIDAEHMRIVQRQLSNYQVSRSSFDEAQQAAFKIMETACISGFQSQPTPPTKKHAPKLIKYIFKKKATEIRERYSIIQIAKYFTVRQRA
jgi:hypothetical protein